MSGEKTLDRVTKGIVGVTKTIGKTLGAVKRVHVCRPVVTPKEKIPESLPELKKSEYEELR